MTSTTLFLQLTWPLMIACSCLCWWHCCFSKSDQWGRRVIVRHRDLLDAKLRFLRWRASAAKILWGELATVLMLAIVAVAQDLPLLFGLAPLVVLGPKLYLECRAAQRVTDIESQIETWLVAVANALKASPSLGDAIASSASLIPAPMSEEVELMVKEYELGCSLDRALEQLAERIGSKTLSGAVLALQVARHSGGNLPTMLENAASALRELARLEGVVRTKTAEGKAQSFVIGVIPLPMVLLIHSMDDHFFDPLRACFVGNLIVGGAIALWVLAILLASKILAVDV